ncbi:hypothetical protein Egran_05095 [Elaphomyces granulatus]|uniref:Zn(2)-C6 fungal-type domain-containing protein n=1 Tax=Elaphomyces granulatus TaxID=519963 RepID=A0A232LSJ9_9EURO|nr:hypothetical protein Egran_05095 [Elaphomyces granulatus]
MDSDERPHSESIMSMPPRADNVCLYCRRRKKKCDKTLPSCLQCKKHNVECVYDDVEGVSTIDEFRQLRKRLRNVEGLMVPGTSKAANPGLALKQHPSSHAAQDSTLLGRLAVLNTDSSLSEEVHQLLQSKPGEVYGACQIFFQNVHRWMPIISQKLFYHRMTKFSKTGQTDFALVLLGILLLIYYPTRGTRPEQLYEIIRTRYWQHNASATASIETVQAGLLLACYEYGSGMIQACYGTTGLCARMGYWMGLHNQRLPSDLSKDSDTWLEAAERCNVWWGIFIRDRCINFETTAHNKPCAIGKGTPDYLPLESDALDPSFTSPNANETVGIFGRQAQACHLLDQMIYFRQRQATAGPLDDEKCQLDHDLRTLLRALIDQNDGSICEFCEASAIVIGQLIREVSALFHLHSKDAPAASLDYVDGSGPSTSTSAASSLALKTAARMVVDISRNFNHNLAKLNTITCPPTYCYVIHRAAMELISLHDSIDHAQWSQDLETLREASWNYSRRWQVGAHHLKSVDKAVTELLSEPPSTFSSFQPLRNDPCLLVLLDE